MYAAHFGGFWFSDELPELSELPGAGVVRRCRLKVCKKPTSSSECLRSTSSASASLFTPIGSPPNPGHSTDMRCRYASSCLSLVSLIKSVTIFFASSWVRIARMHTCPFLSNWSCSSRVTSRSPDVGNTSLPWLESSNSRGTRTRLGADAFARAMRSPRSRDARPPPAPPRPDPEPLPSPRPPRRAGASPPPRSPRPPRRAPPPSPRPRAARATTRVIDGVTTQTRWALRVVANARPPRQRAPSRELASTRASTASAAIAGVVSRSCLLPETHKEWRAGRARTPFFFTFYPLFQGRLFQKASTKATLTETEKARRA